MGSVTKLQKQHYTAVLMGNLRLMDAKFRYGLSGAQLDYLAREPLYRMGLDFKHGTGHGVGYILNVLEGPQNIRWKFVEGQKECALEEGMIVTNEPGVYREGSHGIRTENVLLVRKGEKNGDGQFMHFETLTFVPIDRAALDQKYLTKTDIKLINNYHKEVYRRIAPYLTEEEKEWLKAETMPI